MNSLLNVIAEQVNTYVASLHEFRNSVGFAFEWALGYTTTHEQLLHLLINAASAIPHMLLHVRQILYHYLHLGITSWLLKLCTISTVYWYAAFINDRNIKKTKIPKISGTKTTYICQNAALLETLIFSMNCLIITTECLLGGTD